MRNTDSHIAKEAIQNVGQVQNYEWSTWTTKTSVPNRSQDKWSTYNTIQGESLLEQKSIHHYRSRARDGPTRWSLQLQLLQSPLHFYYKVYAVLHDKAPTPLRTI